MNRKKLLNMILRATDEVRGLERDLTALQSAALDTSLENYGVQSCNAAIRGEHLAKRLRRIVYDMACATNISGAGEMARTTYLKIATDALKITINVNAKGIVEITIPCLIPSRNRKSTNFITDPLYAMLDQFVSGYAPRQPPQPQSQPFERFTHCVICITHIYDKTLLAKGRKRDHDNIETRDIINAINTFLLTDDTGILCDIYQSSEISDADFTRITVMKKDMFPEWICGHQK